MNKFPVATAEHLPKSKNGITRLGTKCCKTSLMRPVWNSNENVLALACAECGNLAWAVKVEGRRSIVTPSAGDIRNVKGPRIKEDP